MTVELCTCELSSNLGDGLPLRQFLLATAPKSAAHQDGAHRQTDLAQVHHQSQAGQAGQETHKTMRILFSLASSLTSYLKACQVTWSKQRVTQQKGLQVRHHSSTTGHNHNSNNIGAIQTP